MENYPELLKWIEANQNLLKLESLENAIVGDYVLLWQGANGYTIKQIEEIHENEFDNVGWPIVNYIQIEGNQYSKNDGAPHSPDLKRKRWHVYAPQEKTYFAEDGILTFAKQQLTMRIQATNRLRRDEPILGANEEQEI